MEECHKSSLALIRRFLDELDYLGRGRALDVAAGDGRVAMDILRRRFEKVDCFD